MEISDFISQFLRLREKELEQQVWEVWLAKLPNMTERNYISYDDILNIAKRKETIKDIPQNGVYVDQCFF